MNKANNVSNSNLGNTHSTFIHIVPRDNQIIIEKKVQLMPDLPKLVSTTEHDKKIVDVVFSSKNDIINKLEKDETNEIQFYNIIQIDKLRAKKRNNTNFRSRNIVSDMALVRGTKFYEKKQKNDFEQMARQTMKQQGEILLMGEIYEQLEEDLDSKNAVALNSQRNEQDTKLIESLENWAKSNQIIQNLKEKQQNQLRNQTQSKSLKLKNQKSQNEGAQSGNINLEQIIKMKQVQEKTRSSIVNIIQKAAVSSSDGGGGSTKQNKGLMSNISKLKDIFTKKKTIEEGTSLPKIGEDGQHVEGNKKVNQFQQAFSKAVNTIIQRKGSDIAEGDREIKKQLLKYMNSVPSLNSAMDNGDYAVQLNPEGIKMTIQAHFSGDDDKNKNIIQRAKYYEKQANKIESRIIQKIKETETFINNKANTIRMLRLENHAIQRKFRQIQNQLIKLHQMLKDVINQGNRPKKEEPGQQDNNKKERRFTNSNDQGQLSTTRKQTNLDSSQVNNRLALIDNLMSSVNKQYDIENEIEKQKDTKLAMEEKMIQNNQLIDKLEEEINCKKKEYKSFQRTKKVFLLQMLKIGKDCRSEGLTWLIRALWSCGEKVFESNLPDFLDQKAREFLLQKSTKELELQEMNTLQSIQLDIYKTNMVVNETNKINNDTLQLMPDGQQLEQGQNLETNINASLQLGQTMINNNNSISMPSIGNAQQFEKNIVGLSQIDIQKLKQEQTILTNSLKVPQKEYLCIGLGDKEKKIVDKTLEELNQTKITSNDLVYNESKKKISNAFKVQRKMIITENPDEQQDVNAQEKINEQEIQTNMNQTLSNKIVIYENNNLMNKYETREDFIKEYEILQTKIKDKEKEIKFIEENEIQRIIKEFDFKNYEKRFQTDCATVLAALFGAIMAEREIIRNGLMRRLQM